MRYALTVLIEIIILTHVQPHNTDTVGIKNVTDGVVDNNRKYIRKCCRFGQMMGAFRCENTSEPFNFNGWSRNGGYNASKDVDIIIGVNCSATNGSSPLIAYPTHHEDEYYLTSDGNLHVLMEQAPTTVFDRDNYCLDGVLSKQKTVVMNAVFCLVENPPSIKYSLKAYCMLISCFFILLTVVVFAYLSKMANLPNMVLVTYLLSFFVSFLCLATITFLKDKEPSRTLCNILTFIIYFSMLAALCWINVLCYGMWNTFGARSTYQTNSSDDIRTRYCRYCLYGFGVPTVLSAFLAICEFTDIPVPIKPELEVQTCFFSGIVKRVYLYIPILILCIGNIILFILTAVKIAQDRKKTEDVYSGEGRVHDKRNRKRFSIYIRLFTLMGISWVFEVVDSLNPVTIVLSDIAGVYNLLVGLVIFLMFVCNKKTYNEIKKRSKLCRRLTGSSSQTTATVSQQTQSTETAVTADATKNNDPITEMTFLNGNRNMNGADNYI